MSHAAAAGEGLRAQWNRLEMALVRRSWGQTSHCILYEKDGWEEERALRGSQGPCSCVRGTDCGSRSVEEKVGLGIALRLE